MLARRVTVTAQAVRLTTKRSPGSRILLRNPKAGEDCYLGGTGVTAATGFEFVKDTTLPVIVVNDELWAVCPAGKQTTVHLLYCGNDTRP